MAERRALAESALSHLCSKMGEEYTTESEYRDGAWFLCSVTRGRVNIERWADNGRVGGRSITQPLGNYGLNLTHSEAYDRCWFAHRILSEMDLKER